MTFIDDDKVDQPNSYKSIMMKQCLLSSKDEEVCLRKCLCVKGTYSCSVSASVEVFSHRKCIQEAFLLEMKGDLIL